MNWKCVHRIVLVILLAYCSTSIKAEIYQSNPIENQRNDKVMAHTVSKGETIFSIAKSYNVTIVELYALNPGAENGIKIGEVLRIPIGHHSPYAQEAQSYTVQSKETLYSIAKRFGVKVEDLLEENPELKSKPLSKNQIIRIPSKVKVTRTYSVPSHPSSDSRFISHRVAAKETVYGIAKLYGISPEALIDFNPELKDGLKDGSTIIIPLLEKSSSSENTLQNIDIPSVGLLLPFIRKSNKQTARFIEYYEGFLLALEEMKKNGFAANVYVFDLDSETGTDKLKSLLDTYEMKYLDLIIGGVSPEQVVMISEFSRKNNIKYVLPFPTKVEEVFKNEKIYQINSPYPILYTNVSKAFTSVFKNSNVIYVKEKENMVGDRSELLDAMNTELPRAGMLASSVISNQNLVSDLQRILDSSRKNVIVPGSASIKMLSSVLTALKQIQNNNPNLDISLFGHADWQTYTRYQDDYAKYDTYIYTPFYLKNSDIRTKQFVENYQKWYNNKSLINTYPKYGILGYDTGIIFLTALKKHGKNFDSDSNSTSGSTLQTPFVFKKEGSLGGYLNVGFYIVHYGKDGSIEKTEYGR